MLRVGTVFGGGFKAFDILTLTFDLETHFRMNSIQALKF